MATAADSTLAKDSWWRLAAGVGVVDLHGLLTRCLVTALRRRPHGLHVLALGRILRAFLLVLLVSIVNVVSGAHLEDQPTGA